jgi:WD40 repeat protein
LDWPNSFITSLFFSPDSQSLVTGDMNGEVLIWERGSWEAAVHLPAQGPASETDDAWEAEWQFGLMALAPDGNTIITAFGEEGLVTGRDLEGQELFFFTYDEFVYALGVSSDSRYLAVGGFGFHVLVFDMETGQLAADLVSDHEYITNLVFSNDGSILLVSYERPGNVIKLWETETWEEEASFTHATERIDYHDVLFTPDEEEIVIATIEDVEIVFMDLTTQEVLRGLSEHRRAPYQLAYSMDGSLLASASDDFTLRLWDANAYTSLRTIRFRHEVGNVAFSPDGTLMAVSIWGEGVQVWSINGVP